MVLVDGNVASNVVNFYMTWIACMLKKIELMTFSGVHLYKLYRLQISVKYVNSGWSEFYEKQRFVAKTIFPFSEVMMALLVIRFIVTEYTFIST